VSLANSFLDVKSALPGPPARVRWSVTGKDSDGRPKLVVLDLFDSHNSPTPDAHRPIWVRWLLDPISREIAVLQTWGDLLARRTDKNTARINALINRLREEEADGGEDTGRVDR
jgi:hypothetical protein